MSGKDSGVPAWPVRVRFFPNQGKPSLGPTGQPSLSLPQQSLTLSLPLLEHLLFYRAKLCLWVSYNTLNSLNILSFYPLISMIFISTPPPRSIPELHTLDPDNVQDTSIFEDTNASFPHSRSRSVLLGLLFQLEATSPDLPIFPPGVSRLLASLL